MIYTVFIRTDKALLSRAIYIDSFEAATLYKAERMALDHAAVRWKVPVTALEVLGVAAGNMRMLAWYGEDLVKVGDE